MTMKKLDDGTEISQESFGRLFGGGLKKALDTQRKIKIAGEDFYFTIRDMALLQKIVNELVDENVTARKEVDRLTYLLRQAARDKPKRGRPRKHIQSDPVAPEKPRYRVQANSYRIAA
jgi:hypothetical protein